MKMSRTTSITVCLCLLFGCATAPARYVKTGGSEEEMQRTLAGCRVQAAMTPGDGAWGALMASGVKENCMRAQGWIRNPPCDQMTSLTLC
jgi:hypothetical protein